MTAVYVFFLLVMSGALVADIYIAIDSFREGWFGLAVMSSIAGICAVLGLLLLTAAAIAEATS